MFRLRSNPAAQRPLRRAALLAGALVLIWIASQLLSASPSPPTPDGASAASSTVAAQAIRPARTLSPFRPGYVAAFLLLAGGGGYAWYLRRRTDAAGGAREALQSVGKLQLGPGQQLHLVSCGEELLVIGSTSGQITLLKSLPAAGTPTTDEPASRTYRHEKVVQTAETAETVAGGHGTHFGEVLRHIGTAMTHPTSTRDRV